MYFNKRSFSQWFQRCMKSQRPQLSFARSFTIPYHLTKPHYCQSPLPMFEGWLWRLYYCVLKQKEGIFETTNQQKKKSVPLEVGNKSTGRTLNSTVKVLISTKEKQAVNKNTLSARSGNYHGQVQYVNGIVDF